VRSHTSENQKSKAPIGVVTRSSRRGAADWQRIRSLCGVGLDRAGVAAAFVEVAGVRFIVSAL